MPPLGLQPAVPGGRSSGGGVFLVIVFFSNVTHSLIAIVHARLAGSTICQGGVSVSRLPPHRITPTLSPGMARTWDTHHIKRKQRLENTSYHIRSYHLVRESSSNGGPTGRLHHHLHPLSHQSEGEGVNFVMSYVM